MRKRPEYFFCKFHAAGAAFLPHFGYGELTSSVFTEFPHISDFCLRIGNKSVQCNNNRYAVLMQILDMFLKINNSRLQCRQILHSQIALLYSAIILKRTDSGNQYHCIRFQPCHTAFNVKEFLRSQISAESSLRNDIIRHLKR